MQCHLYVENEMPDDEIRELINHLQQCNHCRDKVAGFQAESQAISLGLAVATDTPDLEPVLSSRLKRLNKFAGKKPGMKLGGWRMIGAAAVVAAVCLTILIWLQPRGLSPSIGETEIVVCSAQVGGNQADSYIYQAKDPDTQYIWFEKKEALKNE
jgi:hypothetical protein